MQISRNNINQATLINSKNDNLSSVQKQISFGNADEFLKQDSPEVTNVIEGVKTQYNNSIMELNNEIERIQDQAKKEADEFKMKVIPALDKIRGAMQHKLESDEKPGVQKIMQAADNFDAKFLLGYDFVQPGQFSKCTMIVGKKPEVNKKFVDFADFFLKMQYYGQDRGFNYDFKKVTDNMPNNDDYQEKIGEYLEKSEENFKKTGRRTLLYVENMDRLINPDLNDAANIDCMKNLMNKCDTNFHAELIFTTQDPSKLDKIATAEHRVGFIQTLDDTIKPEDFDEFKQVRKIAESYIEGRTDIIQTCKDKIIPLQDKIEELTKSCDKDIDEIIKSVKEGNGIPQRFIKQTAENKPTIEILSNNSNTKRMLKSKALIAVGITALVGFGGYLFKKYFDKKNKTNTTVQQTNVGEAANNSQVNLQQPNTPVEQTTQKAPVIQNNEKTIPPKIFEKF